jgi:hypothetical protein
VLTCDADGLPDEFVPALEDAVSALADILGCDPGELVVVLGSVNTSLPFAPGFGPMPKWIRLSQENEVSRKVVGTPCSVNSRSASPLASKCGTL